MKNTLMLFLLFLYFIAPVFAQKAQEWPQYRGPHNDGISRETGLAKTWPANGPKVLWKAPMGEGYSAIAVSDGRLYTMFAQGQDEFVHCLDSATGKEAWRARIDANFINDQGNGPRGTPTIDGGLVYALGAQAKLVALNAADGKLVWEQDLQKNLGAKVPIWGVSSSPLVDGDLLILPVGGSNNNAVVAFKKKTGEVAWKSQGDEPGYSTPVIAEIGGLRQLIVFSGTMLLSMNPKDGSLYWKYPWKTNWFVNAAVPIFIAPDKVFISTSYDHGAAMLQVKVAGGKASVSEVWLSKGMKNHFNTSIYHNGHIYGFDNAILKCIDATSGETKWQKSGYGKGSLILADGQLIVLSERGQLLLVEAKPDSYVESATAQVLQGKCWTQPTLANGKLYLRNQKEIICIDLKA